MASSVLNTCYGKQLTGVLCCPDDHAPIRFREEAEPVCEHCSREFRLIDGTLDLLPLRQGRLDSIGSEDYVNSYQQLFCDGKPAFCETVFSAEESLTPAESGRKNRQVRRILPLVLSGTKRILCDLSAGAGRYTIPYSKYFNLVLHCDLFSGAVRYIAQKAQYLGIHNLVPVRSDYFSPPLTGSADVVLCLDSLIRGEAHERLLLRSIVQCMAPNGIAVVDFHNWWHNPLRRLGLLRDNFVNNRSYTRKRAETLLCEAGISRFEYVPYHQEFDPFGRFTPVGTRFIQPTRLIYRFIRPTL